MSNEWKLRKCSGYYNGRSWWRGWPWCLARGGGCTGSTTGPRSATRRSRARRWGGWRTSGGGSRSPQPRTSPASPATENIASNIWNNPNPHNNMNCVCLLACNMSQDLRLGSIDCWGWEPSCRQHWALGRGGYTPAAPTNTITSLVTNILIHHNQVYVKTIKYIYIDTGLDKDRLYLVDKFIDGPFPFEQYFIEAAEVTGVGHIPGVGDRHVALAGSPAPLSLTSLTLRPSVG